jgi:hypothetical protein
MIWTITGLIQQLNEGGIVTKLVIAAVSFIAGATLSSAFGHQAAAPQPAPPGQVISDFNPNGRLRSRIEGTFLRGGTGAQILELTDPVTPGIWNINHEPIIEGATFVGSKQTLDGLDCRGCIFQDPHLLYGGGAFNLENAKFVGTTTIEYTGAAANTLAMVGLMQSLGIGQDSPPPPPRETIKRKTETRPTPKQTFDFSPPFVNGN